MCMCMYVVLFLRAKLLEMKLLMMIIIIFSKELLFIGHLTLRSRDFAGRNIMCIIYNVSVQLPMYVHCYIYRYDKIA